MSAHPLFVRMMERLGEGLSFALDADVKAWRVAGCPIDDTVERQPFKTDLQTELVTGLMSRLNAANARIEELEKLTAYYERDERMHQHLAEMTMGEPRILCRTCRNAALEQAALSVETFMGIKRQGVEGMAAVIRGLKK